MKKQHLLFASAVVLVAVLSIAFLNRGEESKTSVAIAAVLPLTGANAHLGITEQRGLQMAVDDLNSADIGKYSFTLQVEDSKGAAKDGVSGASKLLATARPSAVFVSLTPVSLAVAPLFAEASPPLIIFATDETITKASPKAFRVYPGIREEARNTLVLLRRVGAKKIAVLAAEHPAIDGYLKDVLLPGLASNPPTVVERFRSSEPAELRAVVAKIRDTSPDTIVMNAYPTQYPNILRALAEADIGSCKRLVGGLGLAVAMKSDASLAPAKKDLFLVVPQYMLVEQESASVSQFVTRYQAVHKEFPSYDAAYAYDACMLLGRAIQRKGPASADIVAALSDTSDFQGATGNLRFDANRSSITSWQNVQVQGGRFIPLK